MGDQDDDNPATMMLPQVQDPPAPPATERVPAMFAEQSASAARAPSNAPGALVSTVRTSPMPALNMASTLALPPEALQAPVNREGKAGTLIIDSAGVLAAAGLVMPPPPGAPAAPPPPAAGRAPSAPPAGMAPQGVAPSAPRAPLESFNRETPPPALDSLRNAPVQPVAPIGVAAPEPRSPANVQVSFAPSAPPDKKSRNALWVVVGVLLVFGAAAAALLVTGFIPSPWFAGPARNPAPDPSTSGEASATGSAPGSPPPSAAADPPPSATATAEAEPSASTTASESASAPVSATAPPSASGPLPVPSIAVSVLAGDAYLLSYQGYLTVRSNTKADVVVQGVVSGKTNFKMMVRCGQRNVRLRKSDGTWLTEGAPILITCMQHTATTIDL